MGPIVRRLRLLFYLVLFAFHCRNWRKQVDEGVFLLWHKSVFLYQILGSIVLHQPYPFLLGRKSLQDFWIHLVGGPIGGHSHRLAKILHNVSRIVHVGIFAENDTNGSLFMIASVFIVQYAQIGLFVVGIVSKKFCNWRIVVCLLLAICALFLVAVNWQSVNSSVATDELDSICFLAS